MFWVPWWIGAAMIFVSIAIVIPATRKSAAQNVLEHALKDEYFYQVMVTTGVITLEPKQPVIRPEAQGTSQATPKPE
jgi:hypothetical protein